MKQYYPNNVLLTLLTLILIFYLPQASVAQCMCEGGTPAATVEYTSSRTFASGIATSISVPKFDAAAGTLVCVNMKVSLTSVLRMKLENDTLAPKSYTVKYNRTDRLTGPGINPDVVGNRVIDFGPYNLGPSDGNPFSGPDFVSVGPDTVYNKVIYEASTSDVVGYLGTGNVSVMYTADVATYAIGSDYYILVVNAPNTMLFTMTYSYCNSGVLPQNIKNFTATLSDKQHVDLNWTTLNENKYNNYEIELSENGTQFHRIGTTAAKPVEGVAAKYQYQHYLDQPVSGKLYFRIKQYEGKKISYSDIRAVSISGDFLKSVRIYPNPAVRDIHLEFDEPLNGEFRVELTNQVGQVVHTRVVRMNSSKMQMSVNNPPPPGVYYLRASDTRSKKVFSGKLLFQ